MQFEIQQEPGSIIKVIGVGGGGSNAVNHMFKLGIKGVDFIVCNTDKQALEVSPVPNKIQLGIALTKGLGAGSIPEMGKNSALETIEEIRKYLSDGTQMVFITAGFRWRYRYRCSSYYCFGSARHGYPFSWYSYYAFCI